MKTEEYLKILAEQIRCKRARGEVAEEIKCHIEEQTQEYMSQGMERKEAEAEAVLDMGDPVETGIAMDRIHRPRMAWGMIALIAALSVAGLVIQYFLQADFDKVTFIAGNISKQIVYLLFGLFVMTVVCYFDYSRIGNRAKEITAALFVGLLGGMLLFGDRINGTLGWISFAGIRVNVRLAVLLFVPLYGAILYSCRGQGRRGFIKCILWTLPAIFIALICPSIMTVIILFLTFAVTLSAAVYKNWFKISRKITLAGIWLAAVCIPGIVFLAVWFNGAGYQKMRLRSIIHPGDVAGTAIVTLRTAIGNSQLIGAGKSSLSGSPQLSYGSEYVLAYIVSYYGVLAAVIMIGLMTFLFWRFLHISLKQKNQLGMMMGICCSVVFVVQMLFYIMGNTGIWLGGAYCPFLTFGGTGMVVTYVLLGLLLSIYRYQNVIGESGAVEKKMWRRRVKG